MRSEIKDNAIQGLINGKYTAYVGSTTAIYKIKDVDAVLSYVQELEIENKFLRDENNIYRNETVSKTVIRDKIQEYRNKRNKLANGEFWECRDNINQDKALFIAGEVLKEILGEKR